MVVYLYIYTFKRIWKREKMHRESFDRLSCLINHDLLKIGKIGVMFL